jgi:uncharacterized protein (TIGR03905 family)
MSNYEFLTKGTCATKISFNVDDGKLHSVKFENGCDGNLKAVGALVEGMDAAEVVKRLKGVCCGKRGTSCADQLAKAIEQNCPPALFCKI